MSLSDMDFNPLEDAFRPIGDWAKLLSIPPEILLFHASRDEFSLFARPLRADVAYFSVHEAFVGKGPGETPDWAQPISMPEPGVIGVFLDLEDYLKLASGVKITQTKFSGILRRQAGWTNFVSPIQRTLAPDLGDCWRIVMLDRGTRSPITLQLTSSRLYARDVDVAHFIERLHSYRFISELYSKGRIARDLPTYISCKLREVIEGNAICWKGYPDIDVKDVDRRRQSLLELLECDFLTHCDKKSNSRSLLKFAADFADPHALHPTRRLEDTSVTPALLSLLTAAKLYWSAYCSGIHSMAAHPRREQIISFLRAFGLSCENQASTGATLIRPESARAPARRSELRITQFPRRQAI